MGMSHSEYRPIPMSARQVLQNYALLRTARFDARRAAYCRLCAELEWFRGS